MSKLSKVNEPRKEIFDIASLVRENPITKLTGSYESSIVRKIQERFSGPEQQMFLVSFYGYLKYHPTKDFVVDLEIYGLGWVFLGKILLKEYC